MGSSDNVDNLGVLWVALTMQINWVFYGSSDDVDNLGVLWQL